MTATYLHNFIFFENNCMILFKSLNGEIVL